MPQPLVSVIVPIYNVEFYLRECLDSIINQTYTNLEVILIDDGSTDGCSLICDDYAIKDTRIKVNHKNNSGVSAARNDGLKLASGEWVMFVDGDDFLPKASVKTLVEVALNHQADCISGKFFAGTNASDLIMQDDEEVAILELDNTTAITNLLYQRQIANAPFAKMYRRSAVDNIRFAPDIAFAEDLYFNYLALKKVNRTAIVDRIVYFYRQREGSAINAAFSKARMGGIDATESILKDTEQNNNDVIMSAKNRIFMEGIFVGMMLQNNRKYVNDYKRCLSIVKKYRIDVVRDGDSPIAYRLLAALSLINARLAIAITRLKAARK
jgi:glycosyltransferase involved in cell wall biosynthesis